MKPTIEQKQLKITDVERQELDHWSRDEINQGQCRPSPNQNETEYVSKITQVHSTRTPRTGHPDTDDSTDPGSRRPRSRTCFSMTKYDTSALINDHNRMENFSDAKYICTQSI